MDFVILKVNGLDLSESSHEDAVLAFQAAEDPILVEVRRRSNHQSGKDPGSSPTRRPPPRCSHCGGPGSPTRQSAAVQTDDLIDLLPRLPTPLPPYVLHNVAFAPVAPSPPPPPLPPRALSLDTETATYVNLPPATGETPTAGPGEGGGQDELEEEEKLDMDYEEVTLCRASPDEKLGLTLCYSPCDDSNEVIDVFISEIDPESIAGRDPRIREGDQILQINGQDVHSRQQAIALFQASGPDVTLLLARPQYQLVPMYACMEESNLLDNLHVELLSGTQPGEVTVDLHDLYQPDRLETDSIGEHHDKDSGVGRATDDSTKTEESSEQEVEVDVLPHFIGPNMEPFLCMAPVVGRPPRAAVSISSIDRELALLNKEMENIQLECDEMLQQQQQAGSSTKPQEEKGPDDDVTSPQQPQAAPIRPEPLRLQRLVPRMGTRLESNCVRLQGHLLEPHQMLWQMATARPPDLATVDELATTNNTNSNTNSSTNLSLSGVGQGGLPSSSADETGSTNHRSHEQLANGTRPPACSANTSAYSTGDSACTTPLTLELNPAGCEEKGSLLSLYEPLPRPTRFVGGQQKPERGGGRRESSEKRPGSSSTTSSSQPSTPRKERSERTKSRSSSQPGADKTQQQQQQRHTSSQHRRSSSKRQAAPPGPETGEQYDLYDRYAQVMYTTPHNLAHTMQLQQQLFQQQLLQRQQAGQARFSVHYHSAAVHPPGQANGNHATTPTASEEQMQQQQRYFLYQQQQQQLQQQYIQQQHQQQQQQQGRNNTMQTPPFPYPGPVYSQVPNQPPMEWVVKKRPDGSRYITRRPVRNRILKERARKLTEERSGLTTDDDAASEMKLGRYWNREDRRRHLERAREHRRKKEVMLRARREHDQRAALDLQQQQAVSHRRQKSGKRPDDLGTTISGGSGGACDPAPPGMPPAQVDATKQGLLSVTTV